MPTRRIRPRADGRLADHGGRTWAAAPGAARCRASRCDRLRGLLRRFGAATQDGSSRRTAGRVLRRLGALEGGSARRRAAAAARARAGAARLGGDRDARRARPARGVPALARSSSAIPRSRSSSWTAARPTAPASCCAPSIPGSSSSRPPGNPGFAAACNLGVAAASGELPAAAQQRHDARARRDRAAGARGPAVAAPARGGERHDAHGRTCRP